MESKRVVLECCFFFFFFKYRRSIASNDAVLLHECREQNRRLFCVVLEAYA